jgi:hypothetical protein
MKQLTLAAVGFERYAKTTGRAAFLAEMERVVPWSALCALIEPSEARQDQMVGAIREFGFRIPIVAESDGSVVDGHLRLKAARKLGLTEVPVTRADRGAGRSGRRTSIFGSSDSNRKVAVKRHSRFPVFCAADSKRHRVASR